MFRALWIKHWAQLRTLRWVGFGLCVTLPLFVWTGAAAAKRGWFPFTVGDYSLTTLFGEALPGFSALLWAFLAVMFAAQAFAGDRAEGTDRFLLERPVARAKVWRARVLASLASASSVALANAIYLFGLVALVDDGSVGGVFEKMQLDFAVGAVLLALGTLGGMAAGEMARTPMQAVMVGLVLGASPIAATVLLSSVFPSVTLFGEIHFAWLLVPILPAALVLASYRAGCLGEPSGRGRVKRGIAMLAAALVFTPVAFAAAAPFVLRAAVEGAWPQAIAAGADRAIVVSGDHRRQAGWMIDTAAAERTRFLPPPVRASGWNEAGTVAAILHQSGALGSIAAPRLEFVDPAGRTIGTLPIDPDPKHHVTGLSWAGDMLLLREWAGTRSARIRIVHPERGELGSIGIPEDTLQNWRLHGPTDEGTVYLHRLVSREPRRYELAPLDLQSYRVLPPIAVEDEDLPTFARAALSPSGRYWARGVYDTQTEVYFSHVLDLQRGERADFPSSSIVGWLSGDRLLRVEVDRTSEQVRVVLEHADGDPILSRSFPPGVSVTISPDRERFLVAQKETDPVRYLVPHYWGVAGGNPRELTVCDGAIWTELESLRAGLQREHITLNWGGPDTLIATDARATAVAEAAPGAHWNAVIGHWR